METIIASSITAAITLIICLITNHAQSQKTIALMDYRIGELTKAVERHNSLVERTYKLEQASALHEEQIKVANHRIEDLEINIILFCLKRLFPKWKNTPLFFSPVTEPLSCISAIGMRSLLMNHKNGGLQNEYYHEQEMVVGSTC